MILGHNYPFYMQFRGGKGVAATIGIMLAADPRILLFAGIPALLILYLSKYMSLASLTYMILILLFAVVFYYDQPHGIEVILLTLIMSISGFYRHRANIQRLLEGKESKIGQRVKIAADFMNRKGKAVADDEIYRLVIKKKKQE